MDSFIPDQRRAPPSGMTGRLQWAWLPLLALSLVGCASDLKLASESEKGETLQQTRERTFQSAWVGKRYDALLEAFGEPKLHMNILGYRPLTTSLAVYGVLDQPSNCVDAFTMVKIEDTGEWMVADYFCR